MASLAFCSRDLHVDPRQTGHCDASPLRPHRHRHAAARTTGDTATAAVPATPPPQKPAGLEAWPPTQRCDRPASPCRPNHRMRTPPHFAVAAENALRTFRVIGVQACGSCRGVGDRPAPAGRAMDRRRWWPWCLFRPCRGARARWRKTWRTSAPRRHPVEGLDAGAHALPTGRMHRGSASRGWTPHDAVRRCVVAWRRGNQDAGTGVRPPRSPARTADPCRGRG